MDSRKVCHFTLWIGCRRVDLWFGSFAWPGKLLYGLRSRGYSASHKGVLGELLEDGQELNELEEQLGELVEDSLGLDESVLGLGESGREALTVFWLSRESVSQGMTQ